MDDPFADRAIHRAARAGDLDGLRRELDAGVNPDLMIATSVHRSGRPITILCDSVYGYKGPEETRIRGVRILIEAGANVSADSNYPLYIAAARGNLKLVQMLLRAGADARDRFIWLDRSPR